jgi:hypothetical protein
VRERRCNLLGKPCPPGAFCICTPCKPGTDTQVSAHRLLPNQAELDALRTPGSGDAVEYISGVINGPQCARVLTCLTLQQQEGMRFILNDNIFGDRGVSNITYTITS